MDMEGKFLSKDAFQGKKETGCEKAVKKDKLF